VLLACALAVVVAGFGPSRRAHLDSYLAREGDTGEFDGALASKLDKAFATNWIPFAKSKDRWQRANSWVQKFGFFARTVYKNEGKEWPGREVALASTRLCFLFLLSVAEERKGFSRPRAARRFLSEQRIRDGGTGLNGVPKICLLLDGVSNAEPRQRKQKEALAASEVKQMALSVNGGRSPSWFRRQTVVMIAVGFVTLMRLDEVRRLLRSGIRFRFRTGREVSWDGSSLLPEVQELAGVLLLVAWRKAGQAAFSWVPMSCRMTMGLLLQHLEFLRSTRGVNAAGSDDPYLFRSRNKVKGRGYQPSVVKVDARSFRTDMRATVCDVCDGIDAGLAGLFGGHSMRIGGSNWMRQVCLVRSLLDCLSYVDCNRWV
jgi:hypothetical protein